MANLLVLAVGLAVPAAMVLAYLVAMRTRYHYSSTLKCPNCGRTFEYDWVPMVSFTAARLGRSRYMECPLCHKWAAFNIWDTRSRPSPTG